MWPQSNRELWVSKATWCILGRHRRVNNLIHAPDAGEITPNNPEIMISLKRPECDFRCGRIVALFSSSAVVPDIVETSSTSPRVDCFPCTLSSLTRTGRKNRELQVPLGARPHSNQNASGIVEVMPCIVVC